MIPAINNRNAKLHKAKHLKNDEFYTPYLDIESELKHYRAHFKGKVIYCNCDDPAWSNFIKYFRANYDDLGLAGLLTNHLRADGTGDFRGREALAKLEQADIVISNPPFSLFRQYVAQLIEPESDKFQMIKNIEPSRDKKFIVLGSMNAIGYANIFPCIKNNRMWLGVNSGAMKFTGQDGEIKPAPYCWFTNLDHGQRKPIKITRKYDPAIHQRYENYDAINVDKIKDIPCDYLREMGVPITFMMNHDPMQFDIIGLGIANLGLEIGVLPYKKQHQDYRKKIQGRGAVDGDLYMMVNGAVCVPYSRVIIRKKLDAIPSPCPK